jgi:hypothetical protein
MRVLHNAGDEAIHLVEIDFCCHVAHCFSDPVFRVLVEILLGAQKSPLALVAGGLWCSLDLSGLLNQTMAVRRHVGPMMVVVTVMAVALHLSKT